MVANTGTLNVAPRWCPGSMYTSQGEVTFTGTAASGDTGTISGMVPENGFIVTGMRVSGTKLDAHETAATGTLIVGDGTDTDFYLTGGLAGRDGPASDQLVVCGNGTGIGSGTYPASTDVVITLGGTVATGASGGTLRVEIDYLCDDAAQ